MISTMKQFEFAPDISAQQDLNYYRGAARYMVAQCSNGTSIRFPASALTKFVTDSGIHGQFVLTCTDDHKGSTLRRVSRGLLARLAAQGLKPWES